MDDERSGEDARLDALRRARVLDTPAEPAFDRATRLASRFLRVPVALLSFVDADRQFFKSCVGLPEPWASARQTPLSHSFCRHVVAHREPLVIDDAREHPLVRDNGAVADLGVVAYLGVPLATPDGYVLGSLCAIDGQPRAWSAEDIDTLADLAAAVMTELALRAETQSLRDSQERHRLVLDSIRDHAIFTTDAHGRVDGWGVGAENLLGYTAEEALGGSAERFFTPEDRDAGVPRRERTRAAAEGRAEDTRWHVRKDGTRFFATGVVNSIRDDSGELLGLVKVMRDMTQRRSDEARVASLLEREQEALREAREVGAHHRTLIASLPQLVWTCLPDGRCDYLSPQWVAYTGIAADEQMDLQWLERVIHPEDRERTAEAWEAAVAGRSPYDLEYRIRGADGLHRWFKTRGTPYRGEDGRVLKWFGTCTEIEDQKRTAEALRDTRLRLQSALDAGAIATWTWNIAEDRVVADANLARLFSVSEEHAAGGPLEVYVAAIHPEDRARVAERIAHALEIGGRFDEEYRVVQPDGSDRWVVARGRVEGPSPDAPPSLSGVIVDITERKRVEDDLRRSREQYDDLFNSMDEAFAVIEMIRDAGGHAVDYRFLQVNPAFAKHAGLSDAQGKRIRELLPDLDAHWFEIYGDVARTGRARRFESHATPLDGRHFDVHAFRFGDPEDQRVAILFNDITERKRAEAERERLHQSEREARLLAESVQAEVEAAGRAKDTFLAMLSHELRTPINPILLTATAMLEDPSTPPDQRSTWEMIRDNIGLEARLIDDLLDVTRTISGKMPYAFEPMDVHDLIRQAVGIVASDVLAKGIALMPRLEADRSFVNADGARLTQALWNLVKNAVKFTDDGGTIEVRTRNAGDALVIEVADTGIGIEPEALTKIFNAFEQVEDAVTRQFGGLGLGLAISKSVVESHGGTIAAASPGRGRGATFTIRLETVAPAGAVPREERVPEERRAYRILFVEDDAMTCRVMARLLRNAGHEVTTAMSFDEALGAASPEFDLVVSDIGLPGRNGFDLMAELRSRHGLKGIALTGFGMEGDIRKGRESGFLGHVTKPVDFPKLEGLIQRLGAAADLAVGPGHATDPPDHGGA